MKRQWPCRLLCLLAVGLATAQAQTPKAKVEVPEGLLESAAYWQENARADLARQALEKYLQTQPDDARAWYRLGMLGIEMGEPQRCTEVVRRMREALPPSPYREALAARCRVATRDRLEMAAVRRLAEARQYAEAARAFEALFDEGIPGGELGVEYLWLRSQAGASWQTLHPSYVRMAREFPEHPEVQMAYAGHLAENPDTAREAIARVRSLRKVTDNEARALRYWRTALRNLSGAADIESQVRVYLDVDPNNPEFQRMAARAARSDLRSRAGTLSERGNHAEARRLLRAAVERFPDDPWLRHDLARAHIALQQPDAAREVVRAGVSRQRSDPTMRYVEALILRSLDEAAQAVAALEAVPAHRRTAAMAELLDTLRFRQCLQRHSAEGLLDCSLRAGSAPERWRSLIDAWAQADILDEGVERLARWRDENTSTPAMTRVWADLLSRTGRHDDARAVLVELRDSMLARATDAELMDALVAVTLRAHAADGAAGAIRELLGSLRGSDFPPRDRYRWAAQLESALGNNDAARANYARLLACCETAVTVEERLAYARLLAQSGDEAATQDQLETAFDAAESPATRATIAALAADIAPAPVAEPMLASALEGRPEDPWLRHDLARIQIAMGQPARARELMEAGVEAYPDEAEMRFAAGLILETIASPEEALAQVEAIPEVRRSAGMQALAQRMRFEQCLDAAEASDDWATCEEHAAEDASRWRRLTLARLRFGRTSEALAAFEAWYEGREETLDAAIAAARVYGAAGRDQEVASVLQAWRRRDDVPPDARLALFEAEAEWRLANQASPKQLQPLLEAVAALADRMPDKRPALRLLGRVHLALDQPAQAVRRFERVLATGVPPLEDRLAYAEALYAHDADQAARQSLEAAWVQSETLEDRLAVARAWQPSKAQDARENPYLEILRAEEGAHPQVLMLAADAALEADAPADAMQFYLQASEMPGTEAETLQRRMAALRARRQGMLAGGYDLAAVPGVAGFSGRRLETLMVELRTPVNWDDQWILKLDATEMDVGRLSADDAVDFGQFATIAPNARSAFFPQERGIERGVGLGLAYQGEHWRLDLGTTPLGFPRPYLVGGVAYNDRWKGHQWRVDLSRRAVTATFLSFAGDTDPVSGRFWGIPRSDGVSFGIARYAARYDYSASVYLHRIAGKNIPDNNGVIARASTNRQIAEWFGQRVYVGVGISHWAYERNQRFYTFGHGGYYSPQGFTTLSLPLYVQGGGTRWSYAAQLGYAYTRSREDEADYFPGRPDLQAAARAAGEDPVYAGGSGGGASLQAEFSTEYALTDRLGIGARFAINRADFYEPNFLTLYFRHSLGTGTPHIRFPPRRITPYRDS
ncbi:cellulose synthase subunit BcsC-related outer membrane protein [Algiphilus sp.]|uniref:cellulose synthase subunit BcsC-related outer membrane protein n=1 Tax=Algiphilus sp. TaxID=1872431 RepID=UPI003B529C12